MRESIPFGLVIAGIGFLPFAVYGSFGSLGDTLLSLLASISFGFLAATLIESTTGNLLLDGIGIGALLALLGSVLGYDGSQLILLAILPSFAFGISALTPSKSAAGAAIALLSFAGLALFDPTELTIVLGDIAGVAVKTAGVVIGVGVVTSIVALIRMGGLKVPGRALCLSQFAGCATLVPIAMASPMWVFYLCIFGWGMCGGVAMTMSRTIMQEYSPPSHRSRVMAAFSIGAGGGAPIGSLLMGYAISLLGVRWSVLVPVVGVTITTLTVMSTHSLWSQRSHRGEATPG